MQHSGRSVESVCVLCCAVLHGAVLLCRAVGLVLALLSPPGDGENTRARLR